MPGPTLYAEVGDVLVVHFRNADTKLRQAVTMHPHGVRYTPEYDGAYMGKYTRAGGFVAPGRGVHVPVGVHPGRGRRLAVPRPRPQPHAEHVPRPVRLDRDHREGREAPGRQLHADAAPADAAGDRPRRAPSSASTAARSRATPRPSRRASARTWQSTCSGWTPTSTTSTCTGTAGMTPAARRRTRPTVGPSETITARFTEDNPGRWLYHCHVFSHQDEGMAGWYDVTA